MPLHKSHPYLPLVGHESEFRIGISMSLLGTSVMSLPCQFTGEILDFVAPSTATISGI